MTTGFAPRIGSLLLTFILPTIANAAPPAAGYRQINLDSDVRGVASRVDRLLRSPWGIALSGPGIEQSPAGSFWVANNGGIGWATAYDDLGDEELAERISGSAWSAGDSMPTGIVHNTTDGFIVGGPGALPSQFLFATEDGTISGWYTDRNGDILEETVVVVDNSADNAVYTGLAILAPDCCAPFLAAANFHEGFIDTYTDFFEPLGIPGAFTDPNLPAGYAPFNIQVVGSQVFVTYALQNAAKNAPVTGAGNGIVDIYGLDGHFIKRFASNGRLNAPWGIARATRNFGRFSNDILIANFGDGTINAFNPTTGAFAGQVTNRAGKPIVNPGLRGLTFGAPGSVDANNLYFTAGLSSGQHGLLGAISANPVAVRADFSVSASAQEATVKAGEPAKFRLTATPTDGFEGNVALSCMAPTGFACRFDSASIPTTTGEGRATLTVTTPDHGGSGLPAPRTESILVKAESGETVHTTLLSVTVQ